MRNARWVWLAAGGLLVLGCLVLVLWLRGWEPTVTGTVSLDGHVLETGSVALIPVDGTAGPGGGAGIQDGKYAIKQGLQAGRYRIEIRSTRRLNRKVLNPTVPTQMLNEEVSIIPERYNTNSNLFREVGPGPNVLDFDLQGGVAPGKQAGAS